jgi:hypothetical protein
MKGGYSQPSLTPGHCSEQIDLRSAYLVDALGSRLRRHGTTFAGEAEPLSYHLISALFVHDLAEIMVLIDLKEGLASKFLELPRYQHGQGTPRRDLA